MVVLLFKPFKKNFENFRVREGNNCLNSMPQYWNCTPDKFLVVINPSYNLRQNCGNTTMRPSIIHILPSSSGDTILTQLSKMRSRRICEFDVVVSASFKATAVDVVKTSWVRGRDFNVAATYIEATILSL